MPNDVQINVKWNDRDAIAGMGRTREYIDTLGKDASRNLDTNLKQAGDNISREFGRSMAGVSTSVDAAANKVASATTKVESASRAVASAQAKEADAAGRVTVAQLKLDEVNAKAKTTESQRAAAAERLAAAQRAQALAADATAAASTRLERAQTGLATAERAATQAANTATSVKADTTEAKNTGSLIGGALALGISAAAPVVSGALIGGVAAGMIGAAAAAQKGNADVVASFSDLKYQVVTEMKDVTAQTAPYLVTAGHELQQTFANLGPQLKQAFSYAGPDIQIMTAGVEAFANNAMPGMVNSMKNSYPIMSGTAVLMSDLGTTVTSVLNSVSSHSQVFGQDMVQVGSLVKNLGSDVGAILPGLAHGFGGTVSSVNNLLSALKPIAPAIGDITGYALPSIGMFKLFGLASGPVTDFGTKLQKTATSSDGLNKAASGAGKAISAFGSALPIVGAAVGAVSTLISDNDQKIQGWGADLMKGGQQAKDALNNILNQGVNSGGDNGFLRFVDNIGSALHIVGSTTKVTVTDLGSLKSALKDSEAGMTPLQAAQATYNAAVDKFGVNSKEAAQAQKELSDAANAEANAQNAANQAMLNGAQAALQLSNALLAAEGSQLSLQGAELSAGDAIDSYNKAVKQSGPNSRAAQEAAVALGQSLIAVGTQAGKAADDQYKATHRVIDANQEAATVQRAQQAAILDTITQYARAGYVIPDAMKKAASAAVGAYGDTRVAAAEAAGEVQNVINRINATPTHHSTTVDALTARAISDLQALGFKVTHLPNGRFTITANTGPGQSAIDRFVNNNNGRTITTYVNTVTGSFHAGRAQGNAFGGAVGAGSSITGAGAAGTHSAGGWTVMNELGAEAVHLPLGSTVLPHADTMAMMQGMHATAPGSVEMRFTGNTDTMVATLFTRLIRTGGIQLSVNGQKVTVGL